MSERQQQSTTTIYRHQYEPSSVTAARNPLISTSNENESSLVEKESVPSNGTVRRKLERFRSKLVELFFSSSSASSAPIQTPTPSPPLTPHTASSTSSTSSSMSTYYFGYTTQSTFSTAVGNSSASRRLMLNSNYDATSTASSLASDDSNSSSSSSATAVSDRQLDSASANCIPMREANPFLDPQLTSRLIHLNTPDLDLLKSQFEPFLCTIDDEDNFFDAEFMSAYIAYTLVTRLREQHDLRQDESSIMGNNLAHEIAREIFAQSESEPCGLKGCRINVFLESASEEDEDDEMSTHPPTRTFLDRFRFDSTCLLTTFELNLVLKQVPTTRAIDLNNNSTSRRLSTNSTNRKNSSSKSVKFLRSSTSQTPVSNASNNNNNLIYLDESHFHLYKCSLY